MQARAELIRFGVFEVDRSTNELRKNGRKLRVQEQPLRLLYLLLENPGQPVSREAMKAALWPGDTFVDFDHSLNAAVAKLRVALGDPAGNPRFVETVARKGYRFIAPVELAGNAVAFVDEPLRLVEPAPAAENFRKMKLVWIAAASAVLIGAGVWLLPKRAFYESKLIRVTEDAGFTTDPAVSSDGKLLAYASDRNSAGNLQIWIQQLGPKGSSIQLTHDSVDADQPSFSPDGSKIAFRSAKDGGGIYVIPVIGGEPSRLVPFGRSPRFSPDGRWVAFCSGAMTGGGVLIGNGTGGVFVVPVGGGEPVRLGRNLPAAASPTWSPDGRSLLVYGFADKFGGHNEDWWILPVDGSAPRRTGSFEALRRQGFSAGFDQVPRVADWRTGSITFAARYGDSVNLWRAPFSENGHMAGLATRLTSGTTFEVAPAIGSRGELFFASVNRTLTVWSLTGDPDRPPLRGEFRRVTSGPADLMPSISADGTKLAFSSVREVDSGKGRTHVLDLSTGKLTVFPEVGDVQWHPQISRDGSHVSFKSDTPGESFIASVSGVSPKRLKTPGNIYSWNWSLDNRRLLYSAGDKMSNQHIRVVDVVTGRDQDLIGSPRLGFFQAKFSPDDQALSVLGCDNDDRAAVQQCRIFIVPIENSLPVSSDRWIGIDHISQWDDKPRWSPNGNLLYFVSDRDGHLCLWAQRLNHRTKQLDGSPFAVYHLHNARLSLSNMDMHNLEIDVATDKIVLGLGELTGDIWSMKSNR